MSGFLGVDTSCLAFQYTQRMFVKSDVQCLHLCINSLHLLLVAVPRLFLEPCEKLEIALLGV